MPEVFICHASEDKDAVARPMAIALEAHGISTWLDEKAMLGHEVLDTSIEEGLRGAAFVLLIVSPRFLAKSWTEWEMSRALELEAAGHLVVVPLLHEIGATDEARIPEGLRNRAGASTREGVDAAVVRVIDTIRTVRGQPLAGWIRFAADGWPIRHVFEEWLGRVTDPSSVEGPLIAWPTLLLASLNRAERFASTLGLAAPHPSRPDWFTIHGRELRAMDIEACQSAPASTRSLMGLSAKRLACLAVALSETGGGPWYATYSGRTFLYLALKEMFRTVNFGAAMAGLPSPVTTLVEDIAEVSRRREQPAILGSVLATSDGVGAAIRPHLSGGSEISVMAEVRHLRHLTTHQDGHYWMDFFEDYLIPQIELRFLVAGVSKTVPYSCQRESWRFRRFRDENGEEI